MKWIGITGNLGSGKSTASEMIRREGYTVLDADELARQALGPGSPLLDLIRKKYGDDLFDSQGALDRKALGKKVFGSKEDLLWLESLIHPEIQRQIKDQRETLERKGQSLAFYDVPLLFEKGLEKNFDKVVVVAAPEDQILSRVSQRDGLSSEDILERLKNQIPISKKIPLADYVLSNDKGLSELEEQVEKLLKSLEKK